MTAPSATSAARKASSTHDAAGAPQARVAQGHPQAPHRYRRRRAGSGSEPPAQRVRADAGNDEEDEGRRPHEDDEAHGRHEGHGWNGWARRNQRRARQAARMQPGAAQHGGRPASSGISRKRRLRNAVPSSIWLVSTAIGMASSSGRPTGISQISARASMAAMPRASRRSRWSSAPGSWPCPSRSARRLRGEATSSRASGR
jgi:hypothetical protein